jgi:hypothetical protein
MRAKLEWGRAFYEILCEEKVVLDKRDGTPCFSHFMSSSFSSKYDTIRIYEFNAKPTSEYTAFYLQYVIDMLGIEGSFNEECFEFKTQGIKIKDATVMTIVRFIWENIGTLSLDTPNLFFKKLRDEECPHEDKLEKFCYFYKQLNDQIKGYFSEGHSWRPQDCVIKSTKQFIDEKSWKSVNAFFTRI